MARRDEWLRRTTSERSRATPRTGPWRRRGLALLVGWLVLMTVWGIGRSGFPEQVEWFLGVGVVGGGVTTAVLWRGPRN